MSFDASVAPKSRRTRERFLGTSLPEIGLMLQGVIRKRTRRRGFGLLFNELTPRIAPPNSGLGREQRVPDPDPPQPSGSEPKAGCARGKTKVLGASSLGGCLVFVGSAVVTVAFAAIGRHMRLSSLDVAV